MKILYFFLCFLLSFKGFSYKNSKNIDSLSVSSSVPNAKMLFEDKIKTIYNELGASTYNLNYEAFRYAYIGYQNLKLQNKINEKEIFSIIDFTKNCNEKRFYTIDLEQKQILFFTYVAHGKKSGDKESSSFSDVDKSNKSSLGFYITGVTYNGSKGFSLRLHGDEKGYNSNICKRGVVIHTANYVDEDYIKKNGRLGRSLGCPVLPENIYKAVIEVIKDKTMIFAYYSDKKYLASSKYLNLSKAMQAISFQ
ncbi:MAG: murein L,D-transpeptidase catalytic domain family protein [Capnocytophaga sp.]|nr:murein L,D-transpeptidase catalytic domain family protein [Capnocytophaga sp.]